MRIAIPVNMDEGMDSEVAPHFGHVPLLAVYDSETGELEMAKVSPTEGCAPVASLKGMKIDAIYAFGMGTKAMEKCRQEGIRMKTGSFSTVREVAENIGDLEDLGRSCGH